ncbi:HAD-superfamily hydrolase [Plectosphaerella plurivora]|uniref:HAD-superfamily hydrolase n=1 Tax=Plectosphaerella plurivora TaxID=936078 RepID=A0A9P9AG51_9PEZI|nr:HAD-superfamily hydrolase [Plectosphaerella plurivora]
MSSFPDLTSFKALSFDCYGTLVDYEASLRKYLEPLRAALPPSHELAQDDGTLLMQQFNAVSDRLEHQQGDLRTDKLLVQAFRQLLSGLKIDEATLPPQCAEAWGNMAGACDPFPDTIDGLGILKKHLRLIILSNVDERNIAVTAGRLETVRFDAIYTAEKIGSYKPAHENFKYLFRQAKEDFGVDADRGEILHVARSLTADHVPAKELGLRSVWIARGGDTKEGQGIGGDSEAMKDKLAFEWKFPSIGAFADEVARQFEHKKGGSD